MPNGEKKEVPAKLVYPEATQEDQRLYANSIFVNHTPWDFALHFYHIVPPVTLGQTEEIKANKVAVVGVPVTLLRGLIKALQINLERYEKQYGKIEIPKEKEEVRK